jgi:hypothetical protein
MPCSGGWTGSTDGDKCGWVDADGTPCDIVHVTGDPDTHRYDWKVDAPFHSGCITWDSPCEGDAPLDILARAVIANWQPVPGASNGEPTIKKSKKYNSKRHGGLWLVERTGYSYGDAEGYMDAWQEDAERRSR